MPQALPQAVGFLSPVPQALPQAEAAFSSLFLWNRFFRDIILSSLFLALAQGRIFHGTYSALPRQEPPALRHTADIAESIVARGAWSSEGALLMGIYDVVRRQARSAIVPAYSAFSCR